MSWKMVLFNHFSSVHLVLLVIFHGGVSHAMYGCVPKRADCGCISLICTTSRGNKVNFVSAPATGFNAALFGIA